MAEEAIERGEETESEAPMTKRTKRAEYAREANTKPNHGELNMVNLDNYQSLPKDERIKALACHYACAVVQQNESIKRFFEGRLFEATVDLTEHPMVLNDFPCACSECCDN